MMKLKSLIFFLRFVSPARVQVVLDSQQNHHREDVKPRYVDELTVVFRLHQIMHLVHDFDTLGPFVHCVDERDQLVPAQIPAFLHQNSQGHTHAQHLHLPIHLAFLAVYAVQQAQNFLEIAHELLPLLLLG